MLTVKNSYKRQASFIQFPRAKRVNYVIWAVTFSTSSWAIAEDKNGVSPTTISRPTGPGSLEGLGDAFQPALNTGTARYSVRLIIPGGINGFTPEVTLRYDSGNGFGPAGIGWSFGPGDIRRQTDKGLPRYGQAPDGIDDSDRFLGMDNEELVPLASNGYFLSKIEGNYIRYKKLGTPIDHWEARTKSGVLLEFGLTDNGRVRDTSRGSTRIYRWLLERQTDTNGNVVKYIYQRPSETDLQVYLAEIQYGPGDPGGEGWQNYYRIRFQYDPRPDPFVDCRSGYRVRTSLRLVRIDVFFVDELVRRYDLEYGAHPHWSLLSKITQSGNDARCDKGQGDCNLPSTSFEYATFNPPDPNVPISAASTLIRSLNEPSSVADSPYTDFVDLNSDGLPDLLQTDTGHVGYLNLGVRETPDGQMAVHWADATDIDACDPSAIGYTLDQDNIHLSDQNGDAVADLVITDTDFQEYSYFPNTGRSGWGERVLMSTGIDPPPPPFGENNDSVETTDLDFDKRIDVIKSDNGANVVWYNRDGGEYSDGILMPGAFWGQEFIDFSDPGVQLADINGDRLNDICKVKQISVVTCLSLGYGLFDECVESMLPGGPNDPSIDDPDLIERAKLTDINGDGLADLVVERFEDSDLRFWLNLGNNSFDNSRVVTDLPATCSDDCTRWVDINGNGTVDLVYSDSSLPESKITAVDLGLLIAGTAHINAMASIDNGFGRRTEIEYRGSTDYYLESLTVNHWNTTLPFPTTVVSKTKTTIGLDLDGYPDDGNNGDTYITEFVYRDGYYDPIEKQFRGFAFVKEIERGDERFGGNRSPTLVTRYAFHTGAPDGIDNDGDGIDGLDADLDGDGNPDPPSFWNGYEEEPLKGVELWRETATLPPGMADDDSTFDGFQSDDAAFLSRLYQRIVAEWEVRELSAMDGGTLVEALGDPGAGYVVSDDYGRTIRQAVRTQVQTTIAERLADQSAHEQLETRSDLDPFGNSLIDWKLGQLSNPRDDLYTAFEYARNEPLWIMDRVSRKMERDGGPTGLFVSDTRNYYDGSPFLGLAEGELGERGNLHRIEQLVGDGSAPPLVDRSYVRGDPRNPEGRIDVLRQKLDEFGNPVIILDANAELKNGEPDGGGHERRIEFDPLLHKFPITETIVLGGTSPALTVSASYHYGFDKPITVTDFNGNLTRYTYDDLGRLENEFLPGDLSTAPTRHYDYDWGSPISSITTIAHTKEGSSPDVTTTKFFDGLGRKLGLFEHGGPVMRDVTLYNQRGEAWKVFQPYWGTPTDFEGNWSLPDSSTPATVYRCDSLERTIETHTPQDNQGQVARISRDYLPLEVREYDGERNLPGGRHESTESFPRYKTRISDGLDRLIRVEEREWLSEADSGVFITQYRYTMPALLAEIEDANHNIKYLRYDGIGRKIFMNDCNRGHMTYTFDDAGNLTATVDAKTQEIKYTYDGANRLSTEDYLDCCHENPSLEGCNGSPIGCTLLSMHRTPDVRYHYDLPSTYYPTFFNTKGQLSWVEDLTGAEFRAYDSRENIDTTVKRIDQLEGGSKDFMTITLADSLGRTYQIVYPDGSVVRQEYDERGLLKSIPNFMDNISYHASAQRAAMTFHNGVTTAYSHDPRLRLSRIFTASDSEILQDLNYTYDQSDNIVQITDDRSLPPGDPRNQTVSFLMDDCYRLTQATGQGYVPDVGQGTINYDYDRLGNMTKGVANFDNPHANLGLMQSGGRSGTVGRIGRALGDAPGPHALTDIEENQGATQSFAYDDNGNMINNNGDEYKFDFKDRLSRVEIVTNDALYLYDFNDRRVTKRVNGEETTYVDRYSEFRNDILVKYIFADETRIARSEGGHLPFPPIVTQRIQLWKGWNLVSLQVEPSTALPSDVFADIEDTLEVAFEILGQQHFVFQPNASDNNLRIVAPNRGYWLLMLNNSALTVQGHISDAPIHVEARTGNYVGGPGLAPRLVESFVHDHPNIGVIWKFPSETVGWSLANPEPDIFASFSSINAGEGFWIAPHEDVVLEVPSGSLSTTKYYHVDHLATPNLLTDASSARLAEAVYFPFGSQRFEDRIQPLVDSFLYRFGDKEIDLESALHYFDARFLFSSCGRFISPDKFYAEFTPKLVSDSSHAAVMIMPQLANLYSYTMNRPMIARDPTGLRVVFLGPEATKAEQLYKSAMARDGKGASLMKSVYEDKENTVFMYASSGTDKNESYGGRKQPVDSNNTLDSLGFILGFNKDPHAAIVEVDVTFTKSLGKGEPNANPEATIVHEMAHAYQYFNGSSMTLLDVILRTDQKEKIEVGASALENEHRFHMGEPQRQKYGEWSIPQYSKPSAGEQE